MELTANDILILKEAEINLSKSYSIYSGCKVSSVIISKKNNKYYGVNFENASYPCGICAERSAISSAITSEGADFKIDSVYVINSTKEIFEPCGLCRQTISEFIDGDADVVLANSDMSKCKKLKFSQVFPYSFSLDKKNN